MRETPSHEPQPQADPFLSGLRTYKVVFQPSGRSGRVEAGSTLLEAARKLGVGIESICGGQETCAKCQVVVEEGSFPKHNISSSRLHVSPPGEHELTVAKRRHLPEGVRLACAARVLGDLLVSVPLTAQAHKQVVRKAAGERRIDIDPIVRLHFVRLPAAQIGDRSDEERVLAALQERFGLRGLSFEYTALQALPQALKAGRGEITLTVWNEALILRVQPGLHDRPLGLAVDIGTTTLAAYLCDLRTGELLSTTSAMNPQVTYGDDIMSRISYAVETPGGLAQLQACVVQAINDLGSQAALESGAQAEDIVDCVLVGNSVMHHLVLKIDPSSLGHLPFVPAAGGSLDLRAADLGLAFNPAARVHILPLEAGYVGADNVGVILAEEPHHQDEIMLIVDVGTNGEILLGSRKRLLCTSSPTGPAFEGAQITHGMRAATGAIERVRVDAASGEVRFKVIGSELWSDQQPAEKVRARGICGSGILEAVAELFSAGIIQANGRLNPDYASPRLKRAANGQVAYELATPAQTVNGESILLTQADVRAVQLAKGALYTGAQFLMRELGVQQVDRIVLAGAFGSLLDRQRAMTIGMIPDCDLEKVQAVGNAAGDGARIALLNKAKRKEAAEVAVWVEHVTTPLEGEFQRKFVAALAFPHASERFPHIEGLARESKSGLNAIERMT